MLQPNRTKYRKDQKGRNYGLAQRGAKVSFGQFGLKSYRTRSSDSSSDRSCPSCDHSSHQARRPCMDPRLPGQTHFLQTG